MVDMGEVTDIHKVSSRFMQLIGPGVYQPGEVELLTSEAVSYTHLNELKRIPYMLIVGEKEAENGEVSVRKQGEGDKGSMKIVTFANR